MSVMASVRFEMVGAPRHPDAVPPRLALVLPTRRVTPSGLIREAVLAEVARLDQAAAEARSHADPIRTRGFLTEAEIDAQQLKGKVAMPDVKEPVAPRPEREVARALEAFTRGRFLLFVDDRQYTELEVSIDLHEDADVCFVRLIPLVGG